VKSSSALDRLIATIQNTRSADGSNFELSPETPSWLRATTIRQTSGLYDLEIPLIEPAIGPVFSSNENFFPVEPSDGEDRLERDNQGKPYSSQPRLLAWYCSFRNRGWGIYIRVAGIETVAQELCVDGVSPNEARSLAFDFLFEHEFTHFRADLAIAGIENLTGNFLWNPWRKGLNSKKTYSLSEEGLCNSHAFAKLPKNRRESLVKWLAQCPPGYSDYAIHPASALGRHSSWSDLLQEVAGKNGKSFYPFEPHVSYLRGFVPVYLVFEQPAFNQPNEELISFFGAMSVKEAPDFEKALTKSGNKSMLVKKWQKTKGMLQAGTLTGGMNLEQYSKTVFTVRVDQQTRAILELVGGNQWRALDISQNHDAINKRAARA
jgi:hypothetical protein